ncbi:MAG: AMP-binding protein [Acidobacteriota bacterium]
MKKVRASDRYLPDPSPRDADEPALLAPGRAVLTRGGLRERIDRVAADLSASGIGRGDRIAICLPDGPDMAVAFLAISSVAGSAPLNPAYREEEFVFYLSDLAARAIVLPAGGDSPARRAAGRLGVRVLELEPDGEQAGAFRLIAAAGAPAGAAATSPSEPGDPALFLHTSGTTSRPKLVALTGANLRASAGHIVRTLALTSSDRCLNVMPLFHIHGLVAALLASLRAGGSVVCAPGFQSPKFFDWMREFEPTWYTAVPTMHQAILARARGTKGEPVKGRLRFVRSSSASLPPAVLSELESTFAVPVVEAYGMTEASHQMASNPLPPETRKPGTVGRAAGPEIAVLDEKGELAGPGVRGEVVIRGPNVTAGYVGNPAANASAYLRGWFRTGDQGHLDAEGYLTLTGRLKEIINRGGEKISPREIDEVLLEHPAVAQAVAFAIPDPRLGEEVGAAVVLQEGARATPSELREFASKHLADFKVPRRIVVVTEIPRGPTGKLQRIGLAEKLGVTSASPAAGSASEPRPPRGAVEQEIARTWTEILRVDPLDAAEDFVAAGGDSILAAQIAARIHERLGVEVSLLELFEAGTIEKLARLVEAKSPPGPGAAAAPG